MTALSPAFASVLNGDAAVVTILIDVQLSGYTIRFNAASGAVGWAGHTYNNTDAVYGTLTSISEIEDGIGDEAPSFSFTIAPPSAAAAAELSAPTNQGSPVYVWLVGIDPVTGLIIPDPYLLYFGAINQPQLNVDRGVFEVEIDCSSAFDLLLEEDEGARLSDAFHESNWPGEYGFVNVTGIERDIYWGLATPMGGQNISYPGVASAIIGKMMPRYNV